MNKLNDKNCKRAMRQIYSVNELNAVEKSHLDLHLNRCAQCRIAAEAFTQIGQQPFEATLPEDKKDQVYDKLLPSIYEIAQELENQPHPGFPWMRLVWAGGIVAATAAILLAFIFNQPREFTISPSLAEPAATVQPILLDRQVDRGQIALLQGDVIVNGTPTEELGPEFATTEGTIVSVGENARLNFRMGHSVDIALLANSNWSVESISDELIRLALTRGKLAVEYDGRSHRVLEIETPTAVVRVTGTIFMIEVFDDGVTQISVSRGQIQVIPADKTMPIPVVAGKLLQVPGVGKTVDMGDRQTLLAEQLTGLEDHYISHSGRMVQFIGSQPGVKVEVDGQELGFTPLFARLRSGKISYRLSKPGMEPVTAMLTNEQIGETVSFSLAPAREFLEAAEAGSRVYGRSPKISKSEELAESDSCDDTNIVTRAKAAMASGNIQYAVELLDQSIPHLNETEQIRAVSLLAESYAATGRYKNAAQTFKRVISLAPSTTAAQNARYEIGRLSMNYIGDFESARAAFTAYIASPEGGQFKESAYFSLCEMSGRRGARQTAMECFNDFIRIYPDSSQAPHAHMWQGVLLQESGKHWMEAEQELLAFIMAKPRHPRCEEARYRIALGRYHMSNFRGAIAMFEEYMREHPSGKFRIRIERLKADIYKKMR